MVVFEGLPRATVYLRGSDGEFALLGSGTAFARRCVILDAEAAAAGLDALASATSAEVRVRCHFDSDKAPVIDGALQSAI